MDKKAILKDLLTSKIVLFDAGAKGGTTEMQELAPFTNVHAFEPHPNEAGLLKKDNSSNKKFAKYSVYDIALSDKEGTAILNLTNNSSMSSLLEPDFHNYQLHFGMMSGYADWKNNIEVKEKTEVKVNTLDSFADENKISKIDFLKLDTQGTELKILEGAKHLLKNHSISVIKTEVAFVPVYKEQCLFGDIDIFLRKNDMQFVDCLFYENTVYQAPQLQNQSVLSENTRRSSGGDAVYVINIEKVNGGNKKEIAIKAGMILAELGYKSLAFDFFHHHADIDKTIATDLIQILSSKNFKEHFKQAIKNWCPPKILSWLK